MYISMGQPESQTLTWEYASSNIKNICKQIKNKIPYELLHLISGRDKKGNINLLLVPRMRNEIYFRHAIYYWKVVQNIEIINYMYKGYILFNKVGERKAAEKNSIHLMKSLWDKSKW